MATWSSSSFHARSASNASTVGVAAAVGSLASGADVVASGASPPQPIRAIAHSSATTTGFLVVGGHRLEQVREPFAGRLAAGGDVLGRHVVGLVAAQHTTGHRLAGGPVGARLKAGRAPR